MKKVIGLMMVLLLALCACAPAEEKHSSVSGDASQLSEQSSSVLEAEKLILADWENEDWERTKETCFVYDLDGDGTAEEFSYQLNEPEYNVVFMVGDQQFSLSYCYLESMVLVDFDAQDAVYDLLICGDVASSDYVIVQMRIDCAGSISLEEVGRTAGSLRLEAEEFWVNEVVDALGTWMTTRQYGPDAQGLLVPLSDTLTLNQEESFPEECWLTVRKDLQVTGENGPETLPVGTRCYPICFAQDGTWADLKLEDGSVVRLQLKLKYYEDYVFSDYEWEETYFENLCYAG